MNAHVTFVHGWGMGPPFWDDLIPALPGIEPHKIDLGFTGGAANDDQMLEPAIYVTHSLGTIWALKQRPTQIKALISINGFSCFETFAPQKILRAMKARLQKEPEAQMLDFWDSYGLPPSDNLNAQRLQEGLNWLASWDARGQLQAFEGPVLALAGQDDPLLPLNAMEKEWAGFDLRMCAGGGHALPHTDPRWCAQHIKRFIDEL